MEEGEGGGRAVEAKRMRLWWWWWGDGKDVRWKKRRVVVAVVLVGGDNLVVLAELAQQGARMRNLEWGFRLLSAERRGRGCEGRSMVDVRMAKEGRRLFGGSSCWDGNVCVCRHAGTHDEAFEYQDMYRAVGACLRLWRLEYMGQWLCRR